MKSQKPFRMEHSHFFIAGAQRAGTTYLYHILDQHPEIAMAKPLKPEPKYFLNSDSVSKGKEFYEKSIFQIHDRTKTLGEKSTSYLETPEAAQRIKTMFPDAKILITLRNPMFRAISNYFFSKGNGLELRSIRDALINNQDAKLRFVSSVSPFLYLERGEYTRYLKTYCQIFDKKNIRVIIFTRLVGNNAEISKLYEFLGVEKEFRPEGTLEKINTNDVVYNVDRDVMDFLKNYYRPHVEELEQFLKLSLNEWK